MQAELAWARQHRPDLLERDDVKARLRQMKQVRGRSLPGCARMLRSVHVNSLNCHQALCTPHIRALPVMLIRPASRPLSCVSLGSLLFISILLSPFSAALPSPRCPPDMSLRFPLPIPIIHPPPPQAEGQLGPRAEAISQLEDVVRMAGNLDLNSSRPL